MRCRQSPLFAAGRCCCCHCCCQLSLLLPADLAASPALIPAVRCSARLSGLREHLQRGNARDRTYGARHERTTQPLQRHRECRGQWRLPSRPGRVRGGSRPGRHGAGPRASSARTWLTRSSAWSRSPRPIATQPWPSPGLSYPMLSSVGPCHPVSQQTTVPSIVPSPRQEWRCITYRPDDSALGDNRGLLSSQRRGDPLITARRPAVMRGRPIISMTVLGGPEPGDMRTSLSVHGYDAGSSRRPRRSAWRCTIRHPAPPARRQMCVTLSAVSRRAAPSTRATFLSMSIE